MLEKITVTLPSEDTRALKELAASEMRHYRSQAAMIIHNELEKRGLLASAPHGKQNGNCVGTNDHAC